MIRLLSALIMPPIAVTFASIVFAGLIFGEAAHLAMPMIAIVVSLPTAAGMLVLGLPAHMVFMRVGWTDVWTYFRAGGGFGALVGLFVASFGTPIPNTTGGGPPEYGLGALAGAALGALCAGLAWAVRRPDRESVAP